jgi:hypothetical protein
MDSRNRQDRAAAVGRAALVVSALLLSAGAVSLGTTAHAATIGQGRPRGQAHDDHGSKRLHVGNGKYNKIYVGLNAPEYLTGMQHTDLTSVGGTTFSQTAACLKRHRVCKIQQKLR